MRTSGQKDVVSSPAERRKVNLGSAQVVRHTRVALHLVCISGRCGADVGSDKISAVLSSVGQVHLYLSISLSALWLNWLSVEYIGQVD